MLAGNAVAVMGAVVIDDRGVVPGDDDGFLLDSRFLDAGAGIKFFREHARPPGPAIGATADHDAIGAGGIEHGAYIFNRVAVAVGDERNVDRFAHLPDGGPIGLAAIELATGASMDGNHGHAQIL